jgi:cyclophilin family peptidyl-prolyl cis-trans isomerase
MNREARREAEIAAEKRSKMWKNLRNVALLLIPVAIAFVLFQVLRDDDSSADEDNNDNEQTEAPAFTIDPAKTYTATIDTSMGTIAVDLDAEAAPESVNNFVSLARDKFYNGLEFTRVAENFVIQTGSPDNTQSGGPGYSVEGEVPTTDPAYPVGTVAFAKSPAVPPGTAGSQFFIVFGDGSLSLPPEYALIGNVTQGLDVAQAIGALAPPNGDGPPTETVTVDKIKITES